VPSCAYRRHVVGTIRQTIRRESEGTRRLARPAAPPSSASDAVGWVHGRDAFSPPPHPLFVCPSAATSQSVSQSSSVQWVKINRRRPTKRPRASVGRAPGAHSNDRCLTDWLAGFFARSNFVARALRSQTSDRHSVDVCAHFKFVATMDDRIATR